ncbi:MAG: hypothetical protein Q4A54_09545 [Parabacteroides sp.]|nr:hypothetical protein [Parabacteroides sp.]
MAATKDQRKLLNRCVLNEIPVFVLTGTDSCAMAALRAYAEEAVRQGCNMDFIEDLEGNVIPDFQTFQMEESEKVKLPD